MIHVSQLKKAIHASETVSPDHALNLIYSKPLLCPVAIVNTRLTRIGHKVIPQGLAQWSHLPSQWSTWENIQDLRQRFPVAPAWGQASIQEEGNVTAL